MTAAPAPPPYGGACLDGLVPALLAPAAERPGWLPAPARQAPRVVLLVLDGLGWRQLDSCRQSAPTVGRMAGGPIEAVAPTTTAAALASISTGLPPTRHGIVGYTGAYNGGVLNHLRWRWDDAPDPAADVPRPDAVQPHPSFGGRTVPLVSRAEFAGTGFTAAIYRSARLIGWSAPSSIAVDVDGLLRQGEQFVYVYYDGIDRVAHHRGLGPHYLAEVAAADQLVGSLLGILPADAVLVITADHGQVEVGDRVVALPPAVAAATALVSGERRFRWLHAAPDTDPDDLAKWAAEALDDVAWVATRAEVVERGLLGPAPAPDVASRLGDVAIVADAPIAIGGRPGERPLVCLHGALTEDERLVPLLAATRA